MSTPDRVLTGPKVSVIMPAFNAGRYVREAIESVLAQRFDSFELLVADDASSDRTGEILDGYSGHPKVRVFRHTRNRGAAAVRNDLLQAARGMYVSPCDADDLMLPGNLKRLSTVLDEAPDIGVVYADLWSIRTDDRGQLVERPIICGADCGKTWDLLENVVNHGGSMSRRAILLAVGGYDEGLYSVDDWGLWLKVAEVTTIRYLPGEAYYLWRRHPKTMTRTEANYRESVTRIVREASIRRGFQ